MKEGGEFSFNFGSEMSMNLRERYAICSGSDGIKRERKQRVNRKWRERSATQWVARWSDEKLFLPEQKDQSLPRPTTDLQAVLFPLVHKDRTPIFQGRTDLLHEMHQNQSKPTRATNTERTAMAAAPCGGAAQRRAVEERAERERRSVMGDAHRNDSGGAKLIGTAMALLVRSMNPEQQQQRLRVDSGCLDLEQQRRRRRHFDSSGTVAEMRERYASEGDRGGACCNSERRRRDEKSERAGATST